jgi:hypothetical protein
MTLEKTKYIGNKVKNALYKNLSDSTALLIVASPIQAAVDTFGLEYLGRATEKLGMDFIQLSAMSDENSINAKIGVATLTYCGIGWAYGTSRDISRKIFKINQESKEKIQWLHDWIYTAAFSSTVLGTAYALAGESDTTKIATALVISAATQTVRGPLIGYSTDCFRDMLKIKECKRTTYPDLVKQSTSKTKKLIAAGTVAASLGIMSLIYAATPNSWSNPTPEETQSQIEPENQTNIKYSGLENKIQETDFT